MAFVQNFPFFSIILSMFAGIVSSVLPAKAAKWLNTFVISAVGVMSLVLLHFLSATGRPFVYWMGHFPAPWGNEIRAGLLEAGMAVVFCVIMLLSMLGGRKKLLQEVEYSKHNLYYILTDLLLSSLLAMIYTNDLFTAYVFVEINTIAACGLIMIRQNGRTIEAAVRYMIMSLLGSGLFLIGLCMIYTLTGHLLMSNIQDAVAQLFADGAYTVPLLTTIGLMSAGLAIKSALFPFHSWLPDAYGYSTVSSAAMLSSLVSKGYIFLLIKFYVRVIGFDVICSLGVLDVLFIFGVLGMIMGSVSAVRAKTTRLMIAYSSVAQIGYIFAALGLRSEIGIVCALWHSAAHAATKSMLFVSCAEMDDACGGTHLRKDLRGAFYHSPLLALAFSLGALNLTGVPLLSVFMTKVTLTQAAIEVGGRHMGIVLGAVAISTLLNAVYFLGTAMTLFIPTKEGDVVLPPTVRKNPFTTVGLVGLMALNLAMGLFSQPFLSALAEGLARFA